MILNWKVVARGGLDYSFSLCSAGIKVTSLITLWLQLRLVTLSEPFLCLPIVNDTSLHRHAFRMLFKVWIGKKGLALTLIKVQIQEFQSWKRILFCHVNSARALHFWSLFIIWLFSFFVLQLNGDCSNGSSIESDESSPSSVASPLTGNTSGGSEVATMTEPESLGNCEPGTAVKLQGIVWQETDKGGKFFKHQLFSLPKTPSYKIMRHF